MRHLNGSGVGDAASTNLLDVEWSCWLLCNLAVNRVQKILIKCIQKISLTHTEIKAHPSTGTATNARPNTALSSCFYYSQLLPTAYGGGSATIATT